MRRAYIPGSTPTVLSRRCGVRRKFANATHRPGSMRSASHGRTRRRCAPCPVSCRLDAPCIRIDPPLERVDDPGSLHPRRRGPESTRSPSSDPGATGERLPASDSRTPGRVLTRVVAGRRRPRQARAASTGAVRERHGLGAAAGAARGQARLQVPFGAPRSASSAPAGTPMPEGTVALEL